MDLARIEKKNAGDKYSSVASILEDMALLKSNAYLYNQGAWVPSSTLLLTISFFLSFSLYLSLSLSLFSLPLYPAVFVLTSLN